MVDGESWSVCPSAPGDLCSTMWSTFSVGLQFNLATVNKKKWFMIISIRSWGLLIRHFLDGLGCACRGARELLRGLGGRQTPTRDVWGAGAPKERKTISNNGNVKKKRTHVFRHMRDASCGLVGTTRNHRHVPADGHNGPRRKPPTQQELCLKSPAVLLGTRGRPGYACM